MRLVRDFLVCLCVCLIPCFILGSDAKAQQSATVASAMPSTQESTSAPLRLTMLDALARARKNSVVYQAAVTDAGVAREEKKQARDALLPSVNYNNSAIYSQGIGRPPAVRFIANNAVHEYLSQGNAHEVIDLAGFAELRRAGAAGAAARAKAEIAARGLVVTVTRSYYAAEAAQQRLDVSQKAAAEGERFLKLAQDLENGGEVAHSDVIKAELQANDRRRQLQEARLAQLNTRLDLAVLIFSDFNDNFELAEDLHGSVALPTLAEVQQRAARDNPGIRAALETARAADYSVIGSRSGYLPALSLDYFYGIDATHFATRADRLPNLGSSVLATLNIPVWNWGATQSKVKQAELRRDQAKRELSLAQRKLLADLRTLYAEADTASSELASLSRSAELAAESRRLTTLRYRDGEGTVLEVVDAQNTATLADAAYQDGAVRYRVALANLQTLTGALTTP